MNEFDEFIDVVQSGYGNEPLPRAAMNPEDRWLGAIVTGTVLSSELVLFGAVFRQESAAIFGLISLMVFGTFILNHVSKEESPDDGQYIDDEFEGYI